MSALGLMGCTGWQELGSEFIARSGLTAQPSVFSGYPLLDLEETGYN